MSQENTMSMVQKSVPVLTAIAMATGAHARDNVQVAGSSTVLPYASIVAEAFGENFEFPTPVVESAWHCGPGPLRPAAMILT